MKGAGFVDIRVHKYKMDIGNWRGGLRFRFRRLRVDTTESQLIAAREAAFIGHSGAYGFMARMLKNDLPEEDRYDFARKVVNDLRNPEFQISADMYIGSSI